jgi:tRNA threonylcarbamoyladenosine biosynthesis protein TsaB
MALLLNIDTATEHASVCLSQDGNVLTIEESSDQKNHGSFLQPAIKKILALVNLNLSSIDAISITEGPGSYTGLRVGMASAKGLCYALNKPLLALNTLEVMANASIQYQLSNIQHPISNFVFCPMIDARRMEVFTALYDASLTQILAPSAMILTDESFNNQLNTHTIVFSGSGSFKFKNILQNSNAVFIDIKHNAANMVALAEKAYHQQSFANLAYSQPFYLKEFFSPLPKR